MSRRPSVSIYDYPEDLNPFNDDSTPSTARHINGETKNPVKEPKHKFWTFGRNKKKQRSNSFSIKSTWSGLFGKRKDSQEVEIRKPTIATVSSTYKRGTYNGYPVAPARLSTDQQEFDEALGTLTRRRKYTFDNSSTYGSSLTVNGDPGRIYEGSPQDTTASIMGDLTPKPPARRFGQMSPKTTDKIPPLDFTGKESTSNENVVLEERGSDQTPIPPKRGGPRASQRSIVPASFNGEDVTLTDENENVPEDYVFKRFSHDAIRKSNLSINSCISVGSTVSAYGRKKRRAPQPPRLREPLESPKEISVNPSEAEERNNELQIVDSIDIARVTENIDEMTKRSREMDDNFIPASAIRNENEKVEKAEKEEKDEMDEKEGKEEKEETNVANESTSSSSEITNMPVTREERKTSKPRRSSKEEPREGNDVKTRKISSEERLIAASEKSTEGDVSSSKKNCEVEAEVDVELRRDSGAEKIEIIKEIGVSSDTEEYPLTRRTSSGNLSRSDSFSVREEIEKIERQIKLLEERKQRDDSEAEVNEINDRSDARISLQETRKNFFRNMVDEDRVKVQLRELPREQREIKVIRLEDPPVAVDGPREPVKVIELHISEPIKRRPSIVGDREVNPIPKPRRHSNLGLESKESRLRDRGENDTDDKRGNSL